MKFGICVMANIDEIGFFTHAENLGYDSVWVTDSQMLFSDCYAVLALAARATRTLRLGPGTGNLWHPDPAGAGGGDGDLNRLARAGSHLASVPATRRCERWARSRCGLRTIGTISGS